MPKTVKELYTLVDKCARMEEGRKLPGEEDCINVDSEDEDESASQRKGKKHNKKPRDKAVMTVEGSGTPSTGKKAKAEAPARKLPRALPAEKPLLLKKLGKVMGRIARSTGQRATIFRSAIRSNSWSRNREQTMRSVIRRIVGMSLAIRLRRWSKSPGKPFRNTTKKDTSMTFWAE